MDIEAHCQQQGQACQTTKALVAPAETLLGPGPHDLDEGVVLQLIADPAGGIPGAHDTVLPQHLKNPLGPLFGGARLGRKGFKGIGDLDTAAGCQRLEHLGCVKGLEQTEMAGHLVQIGGDDAASLAQGEVVRHAQPRFSGCQ